MSSHDTMNPYGGVSRGRVVESFNPNERLLEWILSKENMETAWKRVKANHGAPMSMGFLSNSFPTIPENFGPESVNLSWQVRINPGR